MKERILAISDIHGCFDEFQELLTKINYQPEKDQLYLLGDYMDRGPQSKEVMHKVKDLVENDGAIALLGNHDQFFLDWIDDPVEGIHRMSINGGLDTLVSFLGHIDINAEDAKTWKSWRDRFVAEYEDIVSCIRGLRYYVEDQGYIFVHAGIDPELDNWKDTNKHDLVWIRRAFLDAELHIDETVVHGHTPNIDLHGKHDIFYRDKKIGIDGGCAYGGQLNALEISADGKRKEYAVPSKL